MPSFKAGNMVFSMEKELTVGSQSTCKIVRRVKDNGRSDNQLFVCKTQKYADEKRRPTEERILAQIIKKKHRRIVDLSIIFRDGSYSPNTHLFFEYCDQGDLYSFTRRYAKYGEHVPESFIWHAFLHLTEALAFLHYGYGESESEQRRWTPVIHRDIKPENVFLKSHSVPGQYPHVVLGDFGLGVALTDSGYDPRCPAGTPVYQPPEKERSSKKSDVWGMGATLYTCCHKGGFPIASMPSWWRGSLGDWEKAPEARQTLPLNKEWYSYNLQAWLDATLRKDPVERISSWDLAYTLPLVARGERSRLFTTLRLLR